MRVAALLLLSTAASAQSLPDAPAPQVDRVKPFSISLTNAERFQPQGAVYGFQNLAGISAQYHLLNSRFTLSVGYGYAIQPEKSTAAVTLSYKIFECGRVR